MTTPAVREKHQDTGKQGDAGHGKGKLLRPRRLLRIGRPGRELASGGQGLCRVEDGERGGQHGQDDERAAEVDSTQGKLGHADAGLDFL